MSYVIFRHIRWCIRVSDDEHDAECLCSDEAPKHRRGIELCMKRSIEKSKKWQGDYQVRDARYDTVPLKYEMTEWIFVSGMMGWPTIMVKDQYFYT